MRSRKFWLSRMRRLLSPNLGVALLCVAVLFTGLPANGQPAPQRVPAPAAPVAPPAAPRPATPAPPVAAPAPAEAAAPAPAAAAPLAPPAAAPVPDAVQPEGTPTAPPPADIAPAELPRDLTPFGMFMSADIIVKAVMLGLVFASVLTWTIWLAKTLELVAARRSLSRAQQTLAAARSLAEAVRPASTASPHIALLIQAVEGELRRSPDLRDVDGIKERITARFERIESGVGRQMMRATGILATIGATAPFVGLFGTVWGIMNSFIGISKLHTTNLAVVAPGIAEALLATAFGLAAAIPAVVIYNAFARSIAHYRALYADASVEILTLVSRDLSQPPQDDKRVLAAVPGGAR
jgi:biopolymer transport protein ExbB